MADKIKRVGRAVVRSQPTVVFVAEAEEYEVHLYVPSQKLDGDDVSDNPEVIIGIDEPPAIPYGDDKCPMLPFNTRFPVYLEEGQKLWAVSPGESWVTFSALPMWRKG